MYIYIYLPPQMYMFESFIFPRKLPCLNGEDIHSASLLERINKVHI